MPTASVAWKSSTSFYLHDKYATFYAHYFAPHHQLVRKKECERAVTLQRQLVASNRVVTEILDDKIGV